jgi:mRNA interferase HigB
MGTCRQVGLLGGRKLIEFAKILSNAKSPLRSWETAVRSGSWKNPAELRRTFGSVSFVEGRTVFNIGGNKFRLIPVVDYGLQTVLITQVLTHQDYDKGGWK